MLIWIIDCFLLKGETMIIGFVYDLETDERLYPIYEDQAGRCFVNEEFVGCETGELMKACVLRGWTFEYLY